MENNTQNIQWFPGHMTKAIRGMQKLLPLVDAVAEICDARVPMGSRNPEFGKITAGKPHLLLVNKCDLADKSANTAWAEEFKKQGLIAVFMDARTGSGVNKFSASVRELLADRLETLKQKGMAGKPLRIMVAGIPNVGKSSFINRVSSNAAATVADRPGVTRGNQWFRVDAGLELLDTPGVLPPKFDDMRVGELLAFTGAVRDTVVDIEDLGFKLCKFLLEKYPDSIRTRFGVEPVGECLDVFEAIGKKRGKLIRGGEIDYERTASMLLDEFRGGMLGHITLQWPTEVK